jgi:hypothetical protein
MGYLLNLRNSIWTVFYHLLLLMIKRRHEPNLLFQGLYLLFVTLYSVNCLLVPPLPVLIIINLSHFIEFLLEF